MLKGFVDAYKTLGTANYLKTALENANFITANLWTPEGNLLHNHKDGKNTINGYLEDYCFVIEAFIALYEVTFDEKWLHHSKQLTDYCLDHFYDPKNGFFSFTSDLDAELIAKHFEIEDNVIPASNSIMALNLFKLSIYFENSYYEEISKKMAEQVLPNIDYPSAFSNWLLLFLNYSDQNRELSICGKEALKSALEIQKNYLPNVIFAGSNKETTLPFLKDRYESEETIFYLCQNKTCDLPEKEIEHIYKKLIF